VKTLSRGDAFAEGRQAEWMTFWGRASRRTGAFTTPGFCRDKQISFRLDLKGWTGKGAPRYEIGDAKQILISDKPNSVNGLYVNNENRLFVPTIIRLRFRQ